jgi:ATP dependent DNA ligase-like protein
VAPMLARTGPLPVGGGWAFEVKFDGMRLQLRGDGRAVCLRSRPWRDCSEEFPELASIRSALGGHRVLLDGELVCLGADGTPDFASLRGRLRASADGARRDAERRPVTFFAFDLLHLDGRSTRELPYERRRRLLLELGLDDGVRWRTPRHFVCDSQLVLAATRERGREERDRRNPAAGGRRGLRARPARAAPVGPALAGIACVALAAITISAMTDVRLRREDYRGVAAALGRPAPDVGVLTPYHGSAPLAVYIPGAVRVGDAGVSVRELELVQPLRRGDSEGPARPATPPPPPGFRPAGRDDRPTFTSIRYRAERPVRVTPAALAPLAPGTATFPPVLLVWP